MRREIPTANDADWEEALRLWDARVDPAEGQDAAYAFEDIANSNAKSADAWAWCARAWYFVGDYASNRQRGEFFERGAQLGRRALKLESAHAGALFWTAACVGGYAETVGTLRRAAQAPEILRCLTSLRSIESDYYFGALYRFLGQALVRQPGLARQLLGRAFPELGAPSVIRELRKSIKDDPPFVLTHQTLGELSFADSGDRHVAGEMIECIEVMDLDASEQLAAENHLDRERALEKLREIAE
jgi:hypothetical protein